MKWTDLNLSAIQYFVDAMQLGSLTLAAQKNHISRPAVSQAIRRLEHNLGYQLITHEKNKLLFTEQGQAFYMQAQAGLEAFNHQLSKVTETKQELRIASSATLAEFVLLPALKKLGLSTLSKMNIKIGTSAKVRQLINDDQASLGLLINDQQTYGFQQVKLSLGNFLLQSKTGKLQNPLITTEQRPEVHSLFKQLAAKKIQLQQHIEVESWSVCVQTTKYFGGTCLVPDLIQVSHLKPVKDLRFLNQYEIIAIFKDTNRLSTTERQLIERLKN